MPNQIEQLTQEEKDVLNSLTQEDLEFIIFNCKNENSLQVIKTNPRFAAKKQILTSIAKKRSAHLRLSSNKISESFLDVMNPISCLVLIVDAFFTLTTAIVLTSFIIVGSFFSLLIGAIGIVHFLGKYDELKREEKVRDNELQLLALRNACANIYLKKDPEEIDQPSANENAPTKKNKKKWQNAKDILGAVVIAVSTLFYTYYAITLGLSAALAGSLIVGAMGGPIGIGIALGVSFAIGLYLGYKKYQLIKKNDLLEKERETYEDNFSKKYNLCDIEHQRFHQHHQHRRPRSASSDSLHRSDRHHTQNQIRYPFPFFSATTTAPVNDDESHVTHRSSHRGRSRSPSRH